MSADWGMDRWRGKVAVVTGASGGIGEAVARELAAQGMRVVLVARTAQKLEALAGELAEQHPGCDPLALPADLRETDGIAALFARIEAERGGVDVLINNAGLGRYAPLLEGPAEAWREMLELNVLALCVCTERAIASMRARDDRGHVIHLSSIAGHRVPPQSGIYSASKHAVRALTEGLRHELRQAGSAIRVSAISPGYVETGFARVYHASEQKAAATYSRYPVLQAGDMAKTITHVLAAPPHMEVHDVLIRPTEQEL